MRETISRQVWNGRSLDIKHLMSSLISHRDRRGGAKCPVLWHVEHVRGGGGRETETNWGSCEKELKEEKLEAKETRTVCAESVELALAWTALAGRRRRCRLMVYTGGVAQTAEVSSRNGRSSAFYCLSPSSSSVVSRGALRLRSWWRCGILWARTRQWCSGASPVIAIHHRQSRITHRALGGDGC
jgi:hypothetical protein